MAARTAGVAASDRPGSGDARRPRSFDSRLAGEIGSTEESHRPIPKPKADRELFRSETRLHLKTILPALALLLVAGPARADGKWSGALTVGGGYVEHPIGLNEEPDAAYASQIFSLARFEKFGPQTVKLGYELDSSVFGNDTQLGSLRNGLGLEWYRGLPNREGLPAGRIAAGAQIARRDYRDYYDLFDYDEFYGYLAIRHYLDGSTLLKGYAAIEVREYGNYAGESYREPHGELKLQRFFPTRTTLGIEARYGQKVYTDSAAPEIWETVQLPSTSQFSVRLSFSQGVGDHHGLRGWYEYRHNFEDYPHYIGPLIGAEGDTLGMDFDSPLLDRYAREGSDIFFAWKVLAPGQNWFELGASWGDYDFGGLLFPSDQWLVDDPGQTRTDTVGDVYLKWTRQLPRALQRPQLVAATGWQERDSSVARYSYSGARVFASLTWKW